MTSLIKALKLLSMRLFVEKKTRSGNADRYLCTERHCPDRHSRKRKYSR